ncbi:DAD1 [Candida theae]|uniref:DASH complex subunit DAD1 n=1 Tax=Candida theae TaxID=1198502 RepID=A0AAD5BAT4_9ASCO|nr:DAD1 [Candida theae]KAI5949757.1 DAD1 [Candida theae]
MSGTNNDYFNKQRDILIQEISNNLSEVYTNLETLNRSLSESIQIGKEFDDVGRLWRTFYDGMNSIKEETSAAGISEHDGKTGQPEADSRRTGTSPEK